MLGILCVLSLLVCEVLSGLSVSVDPKSAAVSISVDGTAWLASSETSIQIEGKIFKSSDKSLTLLNSTSSSGSDKLGTFKSTEWQWSAHGMCNGASALVTQVRVYDSSDSVAFKQSFPCATKANGKGSLLSEFPKFISKADSKGSIGFDRHMTFNGHFAEEFQSGDGLHGCSVDTQGGAPIALFNSSGSRVGRTLVFSQLTRMKTGEMYCGSPETEETVSTSVAGELSLGLKGTLTAVPAGFDAEWVAVLGDGILGTFERWGDTLLRKSGKKRWGPYDDVTASSVGWWTDNGAYYHYGGTNSTPGDYYIELSKVAEIHKTRGLPFKHWQLDSWWYPKGKGGVNSSMSSKEGVFQWVADPYVFPNGVSSLQKMAGLPFIMHNRWFSPANWYQAQGIAGEWVGSSKAILPLDLDTFWKFFFTQQSGFGLAVYEQDFMFTQYEAVPAMKTNATFADDWLRAMAENAADHKLTMQYCMPYPREHLASTQHQNVVSIRASHDYRAGNEQWMISRESLLGHSVGLLPFKDTLLTSNKKEEGGADHYVEVNTELQLAVATLSASIVAPGDGPKDVNITCLMRCCRSDGLVLKADRPAVAIDAQWTDTGPGGEVSWTYACAGTRSTFYLLAAAVAQPYDITPADLYLASPPCGAAPPTDFVVYDWYNKTVQKFGVQNPLHLDAHPAAKPKPVVWSLSVVAPVVDGWALIGDPSKVVGASSRRVASATATGGSLVVNALGGPNEDIDMCAWSAPSGLVCKSDTAGDDGKVTITLK